MALTKSQIRQALREACGAQFAGIPSEEAIDYTFSPAFCQRMDDLIREQKRGSLRLLSRAGRRVLVVAAILIAALLLVAWTPPLREAVVGIVVEFLDGNASHTIADLPRDAIETVYHPGVVPEGFVPESREQTSPYCIEWTYRHTDGYTLTFRQSAAQVAFGSTDTDGADVFVTTVNGTEVLFGFSEGFSLARWVHDGYLMNIWVSTAMEPEIMEQMILSLQPAE